MIKRWRERRDSNPQQPDRQSTEAAKKPLFLNVFAPRNTVKRPGSSQSRRTEDRIFWGGTVGGRDLGNLLVENGLGGIHGQRVWGLTESMNQRLAELEEEAKAKRRGAWRCEREE